MTHDPTEQAALKNYARGMWGDYRRAAALITHHGRRDPDGLNHIIDEAAAHGRISELFLAVCGLYEELVPHLASPDTITRLQHLTAQWTIRDDIKRAEPPC